MSTPLRELIARLADDPSTQAAFAADPVAFLGGHGWTDLDGQDVGTALGALAQELPVAQAVRFGEVAAATDSLDGGLAGAVSALDSVTVGVGEAPPAGDGVLDDPALVLDDAAADGTDGTDGTVVDGLDDDDPGLDGLDGLDDNDPGLDGLDEIRFDPAAGIDDVADIRYEVADEHDTEGAEAAGAHDLDVAGEYGVDDGDLLTGLDDELQLDDPPLDDPFDGLEPAGEPDPWTHEPPPDDNAAPADEPNLDDAT
jgi:hypothetical protein